MGDPLLGATIEIGDMILHTGMSVGDRFAFVGGRVRLHSGGSDLLNANIPVFTIHGAQPPGALDMFGVLADIEMVSPGTSAWLDAFALEVIAHPPLLPDFYISSTVDLIGLSRGFTQSFTGFQLAAVGVVGNGSVVTAPNSLLLALLGIALIAGLTRLRSTTGRGPCMTRQIGS
jgi:hypothetical protein